MLETRNIQTPSKMTTRLQTVDIYLPNVQKPLQGLEKVPVCPLPLNALAMDKPRRIIKEDGTKITWVENQHVRVELPDGTQKFFSVKPTIKEAVKLRISGRTSYKFNKDGSVEFSNEREGNYYWGPDVAGTPEEGTEEKPHECVGGNWDFFDNCQGYCDYVHQYEADDDYCNCCYRHDYPDDDALGSEGYGGDW
jgi:hypothetical protein